MRKSYIINDAYAVILVGGKGKRLIPLSTDERPKAFLSVTKDCNSMFKNTVNRIKRLIPASRIVVVANKMHAKLVRKDFPGIKKGNLILEPISRNTAPAAALASYIIAGRDPGAVIAVLPTDHYISDEKRQLECIDNGIEFIKRNVKGIVVLGLKPDYPSAQFGYVKVRCRPIIEHICLNPAAAQREAARLSADPARSVEVYKINRFVEKPDTGTAKKYLEDGRYLWNSGVFIFNARQFIRAVRAYAPKIYGVLRSGNIDERSYSKAPDISLDYAIMEKSPDIYCIKGNYEWDDLGSFDAIRKVLIKESRRFVEEDGKIIDII
jgi:mannose-1-phosphate guanylyltransferase